MKPIVGLCIQDDRYEDEITHRLKAFGINVLRFAHNSASRWGTLHNVEWVRKRTVCVIDDDPEMAMRAMNLGFHVILLPPEPVMPTYHMRLLEDDKTQANPIEDPVATVAALLKDWRERTRAERRA